MPRPGDGSSHNGPFEEAGHDIVHGVGSVDVSFIQLYQPTDQKKKRWRPHVSYRDQSLMQIMQTTKVPRADKTADLPEGRNEKGEAIEGMNASGGQSAGIKKGDDVGQGGGQD